MVEDSSTFHSYSFLYVSCYYFFLYHKIITKNEFVAILSTQDSSFKIIQSLTIIFIFVKIIVNLFMD